MLTCMKYLLFTGNTVSNENDFFPHLSEQCRNDMFYFWFPCEFSVACLQDP